MLDLHSSSAVQCSSCRMGLQTQAGIQAQGFERVTCSASAGHRPNGAVVLQNVHYQPKTCICQLLIIGQSYITVSLYLTCYYN